MTTGIMNGAAQSILTIYSDAGKNIVSNDLYIRSAFLESYEFGNYELKAGIQTNLINGNNITLSGYRIDGSRKFGIKNTLLELNGFWLWTSSSKILQETNYGCYIAVKRKHFDMQIGTNFRTYGFRRKAIENGEFGSNATKIHENFNLMYSFGYNLKPNYHRWNVGFTLTNIDNFLINQETNPYTNLKGYYKVSSHIRLFAEAWYKTAGALNMNLNYFGFLIRGGIVWNFD